MDCLNATEFGRTSKSDEPEDNLMSEEEEPMVDETKVKETLAVKTLEEKTIVKEEVTVKFDIPEKETEHKLRVQFATDNTQFTDNPKPQMKSIADTTSYSRKNGVESLMKAYSHRQKYSGSFTESFDNAIEQYETMSAVCEFSTEDMSKAFPIMLTGPAFTHFSHHYAKKAMSYKELTAAFRAWYTSEEQRYRLLQTWQRPSLSKAMQNAPDKSEMEVFREVSDELIKTQHQLHTDYHSDRFLRDQLLVCADIPRLKRSLIEKIPTSAQEAMQRIATLLSSEPKSAAANFGDEDEANYGFGKRFRG